MVLHQLKARLARPSGIIHFHQHLEAAQAEKTLHALHIQDQSLACTDCHSSGVAVGKEGCGTCHDAAEVDAYLKIFQDKIAAVHPKTAGVALPFTHGKHPGDVACEQCHQHPETLGAGPSRTNLAMAAWP
jgi:hypothetical protein